MKKPLLVSITGGSGSGKSTIIEALKHAFPKIKPAVLSMDNYYLPKSEQLKDKKGIWNFDLPTAFNMEQWEKDVKAILSGKDVETKEYMFENFDRVPRFFKVRSAPLIIIEGIFVLAHHPIRDLIDYSIYVHADKKTRLDRRVKRDKALRGIKDEVIQHQWKEHVKPAHKKYVKIHRKDADIVIDNKQHFKDDLAHAIRDIAMKLECIANA
ncbi:MAG: AAA family ATPase [Flavobacteriales bacterium]|nr:AAA family ATPase [Flavobacteriales bacterium]